MTEGVMKSLAELSVALMAFFGWQIPEYKDALPKEIGQYINDDRPAATTSPTNSLDQKIKEVEIISPKKKEVTKTTPTPKKITPPKTPVVIPKPEITPQTPKPELPKEIPKIELPTPEVPLKELTTEEKIKKATINIYCARIRDRAIEKITGSGVIVDPQGIILTNAHVAEYVLLSQYTGSNTTCTIRAGSPAQSYYKAKIIFLPSEWILANKNNLTNTNLQGNGEYDYAVLGITEVLSKNAPNVPLPYFETDNKKLVANQNILLGGYPANFGDVKVLDNSLYFLYDNSKVSQVMSFNGSSIDVITTLATSLAEHGSSGGPIVSEGRLVGLIDSTLLNGSQKKIIQGITMSYVEKSIKETSGKTLGSLIGNYQNEIKSFERDKVEYLVGLLLGN